MSEIRMDYGLVEEMSTTFAKGVEQLQDTMTEMQSIASDLEDGALLGKGGEAFAAAIRNDLARALNNLTEKFQELSKDVNDAMEDMRSADETSERLY